MCVGKHTSKHQKEINDTCCNMRNNLTKILETILKQLSFIIFILYYIAVCMIDCMLLECRYILFAYSFLVLHPITCIFIIGSLKYSWEQCVIAYTYMLVSYAIAIQAHVSYNHTYYYLVHTVLYNLISHYFHILSTIPRSNICFCGENPSPFRFFLQ